MVVLFFHSDLFLVAHGTSWGWLASEVISPHVAWPNVTKILYTRNLITWYPNLRMLVTKQTSKFSMFFYVYLYVCWVRSTKFQYSTAPFNGRTEPGSSTAARAGCTGPFVNFKCPKAKFVGFTICSTHPSPYIRYVGLDWLRFGAQSSMARIDATSTRRIES